MCCISRFSHQIVSKMSYCNDEDYLLSENEVGIMQSSTLYCSGDLTYIKDIASGGMSRISLYYLKKDGYQSKVAVKRLFHKMVTDR